MTQEEMTNQEETTTENVEETPETDSNGNELSPDGDAPEQDTQDNQDTPETNEYYGAPETYDFKGLELPEGITLDNGLAERFAPIGKELNLSQQSADKLANLLVEYQQEQKTNVEKQLAEFKQQEKEALKISYEKMLSSDKEIGEEESQRNAYIDVADVGYKAFATEELKSVFQEYHLDYHPAVIKLFYRLGKLCGTDNIISSQTPKTEEMSRAEILYPTNNQQ